MPGIYTRKCIQQSREIANSFGNLYEEVNLGEALKFLDEALTDKPSVLCNYVKTHLRRKYPELDL